MKKLLILSVVSILLIGTVFASNVILTSFNSGELSPSLGGRIDFNKYNSGLQTALNAIPLAQGGITRRPGTEYIGTTKSSGEARLIPFVFSEDQAYILEFGEIYMRVWADGGAVQGVDSSTKLLLHADDFDTSTTFTDSGTDSVTVTANGNVQQDTSQKKFGQSSAKFDGTTDYLSVADSASWFMSSGAYTIDFWIRASSFAGVQGIFEQLVDADNLVRLDLNTTTIGLSIRTGASTIFSNYVAHGMSVDTWHHAAIVRGWDNDTDKIAYCIDGTAIGEYTDTTIDWPDLAAAFEIGHGPSTNEFTGHIDEFRVTKGSARWTENFTPPTFPYPSGDGSGASSYELATPYGVGDLSELNFVQSADVVYIVHPDYMPRKLTRTDHDSWTITAFDWTDATSAVADRWPPFQNINTTAITLDPSAVTGVGIDVVASAAFFSAGHVGAFFKHDGGMYKITAVTDSTNAVATVIDDLTGHAATADWYESSWSLYRGFPSVVTFFEERLVFANNDNEPQTIWMSESDDYEDFVVAATPVDTDGVTVTILAERINVIKWLISDRKLLIGTTGGEWWLTGDTSENAVTPSSVLVRNATSHGSTAADPVKSGGSTLFVQRPGKIIRQFQYKFDLDSYQATNLSVLAEHITESVTIEEIVYQQQPHQLIWCRLSDGTLATLSYMPEHDVYAWARHTIGGTSVEVESIATIPGTTDDEMYFIVKRTINSATVRYIERLKPFYFSAIANAVYSDSSLTYSGTAATSITGLSHLEGESVDVLADGVVDYDTGTTKEVVSSGAITIAPAASDVHVGLNYVTDVETMRLASGSPLSSIQGRLKRINKVTARFYKTLSATAGPDSSNLDTFTFDSYVTEEDKEIRISHSVGTDGVVFIRQNEPGPMTILGLILDVEVY